MKSYADKSIIQSLLHLFEYALDAIEIGIELVRARRDERYARRRVNQ